MQRTPFRPWLWGGLAGLLLIPLAGMQLSAEVDWTGADFALAALLLALLGLAIEAVLRLPSAALRVTAVTGVVAGFAVLWGWLATM
ncbi:hypothetical protein [Wenxinia marina]|nr:hypothetical protein [Wenxinia marina]